MGKKAKKSLLASVMENAAPVQDISAAVSAENENIKQIAKNIEQLEIPETIKYDDISNVSDELKRLSEENSQLKDKLATYIDDITDMKAECKRLQNEYDKSIMKISELTFENATLMAKLESYTKNNVDVNSKNNLPPIEIKLSTTVPYMHQINCNMHNGYTDWN